MDDGRLFELSRNVLAQWIPEKQPLTKSAQDAKVGALGKASRCARCRRELAADQTVVVVKSQVLCVPCAFEVVT